MSSLILAYTLECMIDRQIMDLKFQVRIYKANRRCWVNVIKEMMLNPIPDRNYKLITKRLYEADKQHLKNIKFLSASIISGREQLKELNPE